MRPRKPLNLVGAVVTGTLFAAAGWAGDTSSKMSQATATAEECAGMTGANRTDCEKRAQERMSSSSSAAGADSTGADHTKHHGENKSTRGSDSTGYGDTSSERMRVSQRDTDNMESSSNEGRGENKSPAPSANGTTMDWNQTNPAATSGSPAAETQRGPASTDAPLTQDSSSDSEGDNRSTASDGTDSN